MKTTLSHYSAIHNITAVSFNRLSMGRYFTSTQTQHCQDPYTIYRVVILCQLNSCPSIAAWIKLNISSDHFLDSILHLFPWTGIVNEDSQLSETFRVPDPKTGQMRRLISQIPPKEEEMFRNMIRRINTIVKVMMIHFTNCNFNYLIPKNY